MREYVKKFVDAVSADNYVISDIPFITSVATTPIQNLVCKRPGKHLKNTNGVFSVSPQDIWYTTSDGQIYDIQNVIETIISMGVEYTGPNVVYNEWDEERHMYCMGFDRDVTLIGGIYEDDEKSILLAPIFIDEPYMGIVCNVETVVLPDTVTSIGEYAFDGCSSLTSVTIPNSVTSIGNEAFYGCSSLTSIEIPNSVTSIGDGAFNGCSSLTSIDVVADNPNYCSVEGVLLNKDKTVLIQCPAGKEGDYIIPNNVTNIGDYAFYYCSSLTSVTIGTCVTIIGENAFENCYNLTYMTIPNSVTNIGDNVFCNCSGLTSPIYNSHVFAYLPTSYSEAYIIPSGIELIAGHAFSGCGDLTTVTIPGSVTYIGNGAFDSCTSLEYVICEATTPPTLGDYTFDNTNDCIIYVPNGSVNAYKVSWSNYGGRIQSININNKKIHYTATSQVTPYDTSVFGATYLAEESTFDETTGEGILKFDGYVTHIELNAFYLCSSLTSMIIPDSVTRIGSSAFYSCTGLTSVTIPDSVKTIGSSAFLNCQVLTSMTIPNSVTSIGNDAFYDCHSLTSVTIGNSVTSIEDQAFYGCSSLTSVEIPNSVTSIGGGAFQGCQGLTSVTIPDSVTHISDRVLSSCYGLTSINVANNNPNYCSVEGVLFDKDKTTLIQYPGGKEGDYSVPDSVISIEQFAFENCVSLTSVTIPYGVTSIGQEAFFNCIKLNSVTIPNSITSIEWGVFRGCEGLTSVTIPNSVISIGDSAFDSCNSLASVVIPNSVTSIGNGAFESCVGLTLVTIGNSVTSIGERAFAYCRSLTSATIPYGVTSIGYRGFFDCDVLQYIICESTTPPTLGGDVFDSISANNYIIYVPADSVETYKTNWSTYATRIQAIQ